LNPSTYLAMGIVWIMMGALAILARKRSEEQSRGWRKLVQRIGIRPASDRAYELTAAWVGAGMIAGGLGFIIAGMILMSRG
jgi:hypothetical protein